MIIMRDHFQSPLKMGTKKAKKKTCPTESGKAISQKSIFLQINRGRHAFTS